MTPLQSSQCVNCVKVLQSVLRHGHSRKCGIFAYACGQFAEATKNLESNQLQYGIAIHKHLHPRIHNFCAFQEDHRRFTVRIFPKLLPDTEFGDSFTLKMDEYGLQMFANVCMICMVQVQWLQCPALSTAA